MCGSWWYWKAEWPVHPSPHPTPEHGGWREVGMDGPSNLHHRAGGCSATSSATGLAPRHQPPPRCLSAPAPLHRAPQTPHRLEQGLNSGLGHSSNRIWAINPILASVQGSLWLQITLVLPWTTTITIPPRSLWHFSWVYLKWAL